MSERESIAETSYDNRNKSSITPIAQTPSATTRDQTTILQKYQYNQQLISNEGISEEVVPNENQISMATSVISHSEKRRRQRGEATLIERTIFYQGMVYQIEEEVYSDPDHSSVYTSEDSFDEDKKLVGKYIKENPVGEKPNKTDSRFDQTQSDFGKTFETMNKTSMSIG